MKIVEWVIVTGVFAAALVWLENCLPGGWRGIGTIPPALDAALASRLPSVGAWQDLPRLAPMRQGGSGR